MARAPGVGLILPITIIGSLVWVMVGCIYIPTPERTTLTGTRRDFRHLLGAGPDNGPRIIAGWVTRRHVIQLLGQPAYRTADGRSAVYTMTSSTGLQVVPLCLDLTSDSEAQYAVRIDYTADGVVAAYRFEAASHQLKLLQIIAEERRRHDEYVSDEAAERLDRNGDLHRTDAAQGLPLRDFKRGPFIPDATTRPSGD